jgi:predicted lysophospholipase L1 biosynthesis ABC-type transport system permease subunit
VSIDPGVNTTLLSPELYKCAKQQGVLQEFGNIVGQIDESVLATPTERVAYFFIDKTNADMKSLDFYNAFDGGSPWGEIAYRQSLSLFLEGMLSFMLIGLAVLLVAGVNLSRRNQTMAALERLGAGHKQRWRLALQQIRLPFLIALIIDGCVLTYGSFFGVQVGHFKVPAEDIATVLPKLLVFGPLCGLVIAGATIIILGRSRLRQRRRGRAHSQQRTNIWSAMLCLVTLVGIGPAIAILQKSGFDHLITPLMITSITIVMLTISSLLGWLVLLVGWGMRHVAGRCGSAAGVIVGRQATSQTRHLIRQAGLLALALVLITQTQLWFVYLSSHDKILANNAGAGLRTVLAYGVSVENLPRIESALGKDIDFLKIYTPRDPLGSSNSMVDASPSIFGSAQALAAAGLRVGQTIDLTSPAPPEGVQISVADALWSLGYNQVKITSATATIPTDTPNKVTLLAFRQDNQAIDPAWATGQVRQVLAPPPSFERLFQLAQVGARAVADQSRWVVLWGGISVTCLLLAVAAASAESAVQVGVALAPLSAVGLRKRTLRRVVRLRALLPVVLGLVVGCLALWPLAQPLLEPEFGSGIPWGLVGGLTVFGLFFTVSISSLLEREAEQALIDWRPGD